MQRKGRASPERAERCLKFIPVWKHRAPTWSIDFGRVKDVVGRYGERVEAMEHFRHQYHITTAEQEAHWKE